MNNSISSTITGKIKIKMVLLGNQAVGKSSIIEKYIHDQFDETANPTVGVDFLAKNITHRTRNYRLQLWDTAGQERFRSLIPSYLKDATCALIVFDVTSRSSLAGVDLWINLYNENKSSEGCIFLVGNKIDLEYREVTAEEGAAKAKQLNVAYWEISAKTGVNIEEMFLKLIDGTTEPHVLSRFEESIKEEMQKEEELEVKSTEEKTVQQPEKKGQGLVLKNEPVGKVEKKKTCC